MRMKKIKRCDGSTGIHVIKPFCIFKIINNVKTIKIELFKLTIFDSSSNDEFTPSIQ